MRAALVEFELESATQNVGPFYAGHEMTLRFLSREAVCSAFTYSDRIWQERDEQYRPLVFPFDSTPAEPTNPETMRTAEVTYKAGDDPKIGLLRFGKQTVLMPGSRFRCAMWGELPELVQGQVILIGKKRAPARVTHVVLAEVEPDTTSDGPTLPLQLSAGTVMRQPAFAPLAGTQRYLIVKLPLTPTLRRFQVGGYVVPLPEE